MDKRQEVMNKLKEEYKVKCPKCKGIRFIKTSREEVEINVKPDVNVVEDDYIGFLDSDETYECIKCGRKLKEKEI